MGTLPRHCHNEVVVDASPTAVWAVAGDPVRVGEWSHETERATWLDGATAPAVGARFVGHNKVQRSKWSRTSEIIALDPGRSITWRTVRTKLYRDSTEWTITVDPEGSGSRITQSFRILSIGWFMDRLFYAVVPAHRDRKAALLADLVRIGEVAGATVTS
jgi:uncharacterized protein YndB with AHSA1/START domain